MEYYFSRRNLRKDTFLKKQINDHPDGFVKISLLVTFRRLKALSKDVAEVAEALRTSPDLVLNDDGTLIKPSVDHLKDLKEPVVLSDRKFARYDKCRKFFREMLRRYKEGGEVSSRDADFLKDLLAIWHPMYYEEKKGCGIKGFKVGKDKGHGGKTTCFILVRTDDTEDEFSYLKCVAAAFQRGSPTSRNKPEAAPKPQAEKECPEGTFVRDTVVKCGGLLNEAGRSNIDKLKEYFAKYGDVGWVDNETAGNGNAYVQFKQAPSAQKAVAETAHTCELAAGLTVALVQGDEEKQYHKRRFDELSRGCKHPGGNVKDLKEPVVLSDRKFARYDKCRKFFRKMLRRYKEGGEVSSRDADFLKDLLAIWHPMYYEEKKGCGIKGFKVGKDKDHGGKTTCFILVRTDDTEDEFSYLKCVAAAFQRGSPTSRNKPELATLVIPCKLSVTENNWFFQIFHVATRMFTFPAQLVKPSFVVLFLLVTLDQSDCQSCSELTGMSSFGNGFLCAGRLLELHIGIPISCRFIVNPSNISIFGEILFQFVDVTPARLVQQTAAFDNSVPDKRAFGTFFFSLRLRGSFFRKMLRRYKEGGKVSSRDADFLKDLLAIWHPMYYEEKKGCGIKGFKVGKDKDNGGKTTCFILVRTDDTEDEFSYLKCVAAAFQRGSPTSRNKPEAAPKPQAKKECAEGTFVWDTVVKCGGLLNEAGRSNIDKLKEYFAKYGDVGWVDNETAGNGNAYVQFKQAPSAQKAVAETAHTCELAAGLTVALVQGDEEKQYHKRRFDELSRGCKHPGGNDGNGGNGKGAKRQKTD